MKPTYDANAEIALAEVDVSSRKRDSPVGLGFCLASLRARYPH